MDRAEFGAALRTWRERMRPSDAGLPAGVRRRTPGLRREEVAQLAGVSVDYVTRLEQGRGAHPSEPIVAALARALRVTDTEREHLYRLADVPLPSPRRYCDTVRPSVQRLMDRFTDLPALILDASKEVIAWNPMAAALLGDFSAVPARDRNIARRRFAVPPQTGPEWDRMSRAMVSDLRRSAARYPDDPRMTALVGELHRNPEFARLWELRELDEHHVDTKLIDHPRLGPLVLDCNALQVDCDDQTLLVYSAAPGTREAEALDLLRVVGLQDMTAPG